MRLPIFDSLSFILPTDRRFAVLVKSPPARQELVSLLCEVKQPDGGRLECRASVSYPVGFSSGLYAKLSVIENISFVARLFGVDRRSLIDLIAPILGASFEIDAALGDLPSSHKQQFACVLSYALPFDTYVANNTLMPHDEDLRRRLMPLVEARLARSGLILVTGTPQAAQASCIEAAVLQDDRLVHFATVGEAVAAFRRM